MNRIIRQASVIGLLVLAVSIGANAQASQQYRADIPFGFEVDGKHYAAGEYSIGPMSQASSPGAIVLRDLEHGKARVLGVSSVLGDNNWNRTGKLIFLKIDGKYTLSQISTPTFKMKMKGQTARNEVARRTAPDSTVVSIDLKR